MSRDGGASYADARIARYRDNQIATREQQIINVVDQDSTGCGVRALVDGTWGFAATRTLTKAGVAAAAREATAIAKANRIARDKAVQLAPAPAQPNAPWRTPHTVDPFTVPVEEKASLLLKANAEAMKVPGVRFVFSALFFRKQERNYANTDGSVIAQTVLQSWPLMQITAVAPDFSDFQNRATSWRRPGEDTSTSPNATCRAMPASGVKRRRRSSRRSPWKSADTTSCFIRRISGSRFTSRSRIRPSSIAPWGTRRTTRARASSRRRTSSSASSSTAPHS